MIAVLYQVRWFRIQKGLPNLLFYNCIFNLGNQTLIVLWDISTLDIILRFIIQYYLKIFLPSDYFILM